jgi:hypothetical protein
MLRLVAENMLIEEEVNPWSMHGMRDGVWSEEAYWWRVIIYSEHTELKSESHAVVLLHLFGR